MIYINNPLDRSRLFIPRIVKLTTLYKIQRVKTHNSYLLYYKHQQWQLYFIYITNLRTWNDDIGYLLVVMECSSRNFFVSPLKNKSTLETIKSFEMVHSHIGCSPHSIYVDQGCELNSHAFMNYCE